MTTKMDIVRDEINYALQKCMVNHKLSPHEYHMLVQDIMDEIHDYLPEWDKEAA